MILRSFGTMVRRVRLSSSKWRGRWQRDRDRGGCPGCGRPAVGALDPDSACASGRFRYPGRKRFTTHSCLPGGNGLLRSRCSLVRSSMPPGGAAGAARRRRFLGLPTAQPAGGCWRAARCSSSSGGATRRERSSTPRWWMPKGAPAASAARSEAALGSRFHLAVDAAGAALCHPASGPATRTSVRQPARRSWHASCSCQRPPAALRARGQTRGYDGSRAAPAAATCAASSSMISGAPRAWQSGPAGHADRASRQPPAPTAARPARPQALAGRAHQQLAAQPAGASPPAGSVDPSTGWRSSRWPPPSPFTERSKVSLC